METRLTRGAVARPAVLDVGLAWTGYDSDEAELLRSDAERWPAWRRVTGGGTTTRGGVRHLQKPNPQSWWH